MLTYIRTVPHRFLVSPLHPNLILSSPGAGVFGEPSIHKNWAETGGFDASFSQGFQF